MSKELKKILYAEDEEDIRTIVAFILEELHGFDVTYCSDGEEVLQKASNMVPDLFLFDVMMPKMDGPTALIELRKNPLFADVPAIFMTAKIQSNEIQHYKSIGAIDVINKPFDPMQIGALIKAAWVKHES